jgi:hypothetical protein
MAYIIDEDLTGGSSATLSLSNDYLEGTPIVNFNGRMLYSYYESTANDKDIILDKAPLATDSILVSYYTNNEIDRQNSVRYITTRQVKSRTNVTALVSVSAATVEKYIREVERCIDTICGSWQKYYDLIVESGIQRNTFPRVQDALVEGADYPAIPYDITQCALYAVENIYLLGDVVATSRFKSEKLGDYSYTVKDGSSIYDFAINQIGERATAMLRGYTKRTGEIDIFQVDTPVDTLNSRQRFLRNR